MSTALILLCIFAVPSSAGYSGGSGTEAEPYRIGTVADWQELMDTVGDWDKHFVLIADLDMNGVTMTPVGNDPNKFTGVFDGDDYVIRNANVNMPASDYAGLFGYLAAPGQIRNLGVQDASIFGRTYVGGLVGGNESGTVSNCYSTGSVSGDDYFGGLVGKNNRTITNSYSTGWVSGDRFVGGLVGGNYGTVSNSYSTGSVSGDRFVGGLVGYDEYGTIINCYSTGSATGTSDCVGGLVGKSGGISNCYSTGSVSGRYYVGGLVGENYDTVSNSYSTGSVSGDRYVGGLVGWNRAGISNCHSTGSVTGGELYVGGLVGWNKWYGTITNCYITNCYSTGSVSGNQYAGGLVGENSDGAITNCYSTGSVSGDRFVGGLTGDSYDIVSNCYSTGPASGNRYVGGLAGYNYGTITNCYSTGSVSGTGSNVGGLVGYNRAGISNSFWDVNTSGWATSDGGTGKTTAEMKRRSTFTGAGWDFDSDWRIVSGFTYPFLAWEADFLSQLTIEVTASASFHTASNQLSISATAYDRAAGDYITSGSGSYYINGMGKSGQMTYGGGLWRAVVDLSASPPGPGQYTVVVSIAGGSANCVFNVGGQLISINGFVKDVDGVELSGIPVALYSSNDYFSSDSNSLATVATEPNGFYHFDNRVPGWYIVDINTVGYIPDYQYCWGIVSAETVQVDFVLTPTRTLARLISQMSYLRDDIEQAMGHETGLFSVISYQAVEDLSYSFEAIDVISCMGDVLGGFTGVLQSVPLSQAEAFRKIIWEIQVKPPLKMIAREGIEYLVQVDAQRLLPDDMDDWKAWDFSELTEMDIWVNAHDELIMSDSNFAASARLNPVANDFDYEKAQQVIASQRSQIWELRKGEMTAFLALPDSDDGFMGTSIPIGYQLWLMNHAAISHLGVQKRIWTSVQVGSGTAAVASAWTGAGAGIFGTIYTCASFVKTTTGFVETTAGFAGGFTYALNAQGWVRDIAALPLPYTDTKEFLVNEASNPYYLSNTNTFSTDANLDLNIATGSIILPPPFLPGTFNDASVQITNTSNVPAQIKMVPRGWWDYQLPEAFPFLGELFGGVRQIKAPSTVGAPQSIWLAPSESTTVSIPYLGFYLDPINMFNPHWLAVDIYAGPFLVKSLSRPYYVFKVTPMMMSSAEQQELQGVNDLAASFEKHGQAQVMGDDDYASMVPVISTLASGVVDADTPIIEQQFIVDANCWSVGFKLIGDTRANIALQVYDSNGNCVGYDEPNGGVQNEFVAVYTGSGSGIQDVTIPGAAGRTYTVRAVLEGAATGEAFGIQLLAFVTPVRPAVFAAMPANISVISQPDNNVTLQVTLGEAGQQQPVHDVNVSLSNLLGSDANTVLTVVGPNYIDVNDIPAASSQVASFTVYVPRDVPAGTFAGQITVISSNAGTITIPVAILTTDFVDITYDGIVDNNDVADFSNQWLHTSMPPADFNGDGRVDFLDYAYLANKWLYEADWHSD